MRCFIAIELPQHVRERLTDLQRELGDRGLNRSIRWTRPEQIHLTLKFLGEVPDAKVSHICQATSGAVAALPAIPLELRGIGCFPPSGPSRVVWAGIVGPPAELTACQQAIESAMTPLGYPPEQRAFTPHLTIGRSRDPRGDREVRALLGVLPEFRCAAWTAKEILVIQSVLGSGGPTYHPLARVPLANSEPARRQAEQSRNA